MALTNSWTCDQPSGSRLVFENILALLKPRTNPKILELGDSTGNSTIGMLSYLPSASALVAEKWEEAKVREAFISNVSSSGIGQRVSLLEGETMAMLFQLLEDKSNFDFIYVNSSFKALETYGTMILAWEMLKTGGILGLDGYERDDSQNVLNTPRAGIDYFLEKYAQRYVLLDKGWRIFLLKR